MVDETATHPGGGWLPRGRGKAKSASPIFVLVWSQHEPERVGEIAVVPSGRSVLGRGEGEVGEARLSFGRRRPGAPASRPLASPGISRRHLVVERGESVRCEGVGKKAVRVEGREGASALDEIGRAHV